MANDKRKKKQKSEEQTAEAEEKKRRKICNVDGDGKTWSNVDQLCYVLTKRFPVLDKASFDDKLAAAVENLKGAYNGGTNLNIAGLQQYVPKIKTHLEITIKSLTILDLGEHQVIVGPIGNPPFGAFNLSTSAPQSVKVDLKDISLRDIDIKIDIPNDIYLLFDKISGYLRIICTPEGIRVKCENGDYDSIVIYGTADEIVIGMKGDILEVVNLVNFSMRAEWKTPNIEIPVPHIDVTMNPFNPVSFETVPVEIIGSRLITKTVYDGGKIEKEVIDYFNEKLLPKYLP